MDRCVDHLTKFMVHGSGSKMLPVVSSPCLESLSASVLASVAPSPITSIKLNVPIKEPPVRLKPQSLLEQQGNLSRD